jgi:hypothetical protein
VNGTMRAPTAAPEPLLVPPAVCSRFHGLRVLRRKAAVLPRKAAYQLAT